MKPSVTAVELAEIAGIYVSTLFVTVKALRSVLEHKTEDDKMLGAEAA